ncbi:acyl-CoA dehydrogenase family protein [Patulibacter sp. NPDC049589]|uniref:acyl-CoA dehydrogenase family protein n=1 Tax=Patulibacter sp. NPDC049589 TaxID=3154731 RepID=UPI003427769B
MSTLDHAPTGTAAGLRPFVLSDDVLDRFAARAPEYDREGRFFREDLDELRDLGYLGLNVPESVGGHGRTLLETAREQRRLGYRSISTALAVNMHLYWTGTAADAHRRGDSSLDWVLAEAAAGRVFAAGHGEPANDLGIDDSTTRAEPTGDGGYRFTGHKIFGSLTPAWDWFGLHGRDDSDPEHPKIVHAFVRRDAPGIRIEERWDTIGLRATRSEDTHLDGTPAAAQNVATVLTVGEPSVADPFVLSLFAWALVGIGSVYHGLAQRALDVAVAHARTRVSRKNGGAPLADDPYARHQIAQAALELERLEAQLERVASDWSDGVDHGDRWPAKITAAKYQASESARRVVELSSLVVGGASLFRGHELERIYRDVPGAAFHPASGALTHEILALTALGAAEAGLPPSGAAVRLPHAPLSPTTPS